MLYITKLVFEMVNAKFFRSIHGNALILVILVLRVGYECGLQKKKKKNWIWVTIMNLMKNQWLW